MRRWGFFIIRLVLGVILVIVVMKLIAEYLFLIGIYEVRLSFWIRSPDLYSINREFQNTIIEEKY